MSNATPAGWFGDPHQRHQLRYWDGEVWTSWVADGPVTFDESGSFVVVHRRRAWTSSLVSMRVFVDGHFVGRIFNGGIASFPVSAGAHRVRIKQTYLASREVDITVPPHAYLECAIRGGGLIHLGLSLIRPRRSLALARGGDTDGVSALVAVVSIAATLAAWFAISVLAHLLVVR